MPGDDVMSHATDESAQDFYELLGIGPYVSDGDLRKAYRKMALKYHPDKNRGDAAIVEKFHAISIAYDVLSDAAARAAYDGVRAARQTRQAKRGAMDDRRRAFAEDLERREQAFRSGQTARDDAEQKLQREMARLAEDGRRRREEKTARLRQELEEEEERERQAEAAARKEKEAPKVEEEEVAVADRSVSVRFARKKADGPLDQQALIEMFSRFGKVELVMLKSKEHKLREGRWSGEKGTAATVLFESVAGAHNAASFAPQLFDTDPAWKAFHSVNWRSKMDPTEQAAAGLPTPTESPRPADAAPGTWQSIRGLQELEAFTMKRLKQAEKAKMDRLLQKSEPTPADDVAMEEAPKFSFKPTSDTPLDGMEEITRSRLRDAERKRLEEQIRKGEAESDIFA